MKQFLSFIESEIASFNAVLTESDSTHLSDKERDRLIDIKRFYARVLEWFGNVSADATTLEATLKENI